MLDAGFYNMDCMEAMRSFPDGFFELAIVDPPYGDAGNSGGGTTASAGCSTDTNAPNPSGGVSRQVASRGGLERTGGTWAAKYEKKIIAWDVAPGDDYFIELFRVSRNQIIWGGNYFNLPPTRGFIVWDKGIPENFSMAMCEYAWTSFFANAKICKYTPQGTQTEKRFHPTQKPVKLYEWVLKNYAKEGDKILDTHVGSASSLIACHRGGYRYWGFEIDPDYYRMAKERLDAACAQVSVFDML